jgi:carbon-monoxide dehydrogenase medium subunit
MNIEGFFAMMNTRILTQDFEYLEPKTVEDALDCLADEGKRTRVIAGGTDLLVQMKTGKVDADRLVNIARIPSLRYLIEKKGLHFGPLTSFREIERARIVKEKYTALFEAARSVSSVQIKSMGTLGGNLCHASPAADGAPPLMVFGGELKLAGRDKERYVPVEDFFLGPGETVLTPKELLVEIRLPEKEGGVGSSFLKMGRVSADLSKVSVAVMIVRDGGICKHCRIALGAVSKTPVRARRGEKALLGNKIEASLAEEAGRQASEEIQPITDIRSTDWYRRDITKGMVRDAILLAWERTIS